MVCSIISQFGGLVGVLFWAAGDEFVNCCWLVTCLG